MTALWAIVLCGALSIVYAIWATMSVLKSDAGNPRMQEIAAAVREGAQAYLKRQYMTIGLVGIVIFSLLAYFLGRGWLHWHERLGSRQRAHRASRDDVAGRRP